MKRFIVRVRTRLADVREAHDHGGVAAEYGVLLAGIVAVVAVVAAAPDADHGSSACDCVAIARKRTDEDSDDVVWGGRWSPLPRTVESPTAPRATM